MKDESPETAAQQPPQPQHDLPEVITSVDEQIAKEFSAMHPYVATPPPKRMPNFVGYISNGFRYHKLIAFPILIGFILVAGTVTTVALSGGGNQGQVALGGDTGTQTSSENSSTRSDEDFSSTSSSDSTDTNEDTADSSASDEALTDAEIDPSLILGDEETTDDFYDPEEPLDLGGPVEDPPVPSDPVDGTPPTVPDTPPTPPTPIPPTASFASYNYASWKPATGIDTAIRSLSAKADVLSLQEFGPSSHREALSKVVRECTNCNYALYMPSTANGGSTPILWKKDKFQLISKGSVKVYDGQTVEAGSGGTHATTKHVIWVRLKHIASGRVLFVINSQLIGSVEKNGAPDRSVPKRLALYDKHMSLIATKIKQFQQNNTPVVVAGDFNVNYRKDRQVRSAMFPYAKTNTVNTWANWRYLGAPEGGTYGTRLTDYVFVSHITEATPKSAQLLPDYGSDHRAVNMVLQFN